MLQRLNPMRGAPVQAQDGDIGEVTDFYFDDERWTVRYAVVKTGNWLSGRAVLIPLWALLAPDWVHHRIPVRLTRDQVRHSPNVDTERPVSRQMEMEALKYYQFPLYWAGPALWGPVVVPTVLSAPAEGRAADPMPPQDPAATHLRSCREVRGYHVKTRDGEQGHVDDFLIDDGSWTIEHLIVDTSNWIGGKSVLVSPGSVEAIDWSTQTIEVALSRAALMDKPADVGSPR